MHSSATVRLPHDLKKAPFPGCSNHCHTHLWPASSILALPHELRHAHHMVVVHEPLLLLAATLVPRRLGRVEVGHADL